MLLSEWVIIIQRGVEIMVSLRHGIWICTEWNHGGPRVIIAGTSEVSIQMD